nr:MAG TPA: helix-turn-helix domain protein [Caudoviricetes sp.]DAY11081.1 MAG TPA: helix-turn-helix domain protein [Caudoviricetes sp.]
MAKNLGVSKNTIINWEKGKSIPRATQMQKMCEIYNISEEYIFLS